MEALYQRQLELFLKNIRHTDAEAAKEAEKHWDGIAKPIHGLGLLEDEICRIAAIQGSADIHLQKKAVVVFCADNGVVQEGVTQTDSSVTAVVANNIANGIASVNRLAQSAGADVLTIDMGIDGEVDNFAIRNCKIAYGTGNLAKEPAMTRGQALEGIMTGIHLASELKDMGYDLLAVGEMGIGNTTTSSAVIRAMTGLPAEQVTGRGAGLSDAGLQKKIQVVRDAVKLHFGEAAIPDMTMRRVECKEPEAKNAIQNVGRDPLKVLSCVGGFDIAGMCGLMIGCAINHVPVILDGMISLAAAVLVQALCPAAVDYMIASHLGKEPACADVMDLLGLKAPIHAELALGEGTGAVMLMPLLDMAHAVYRENPNFDDIHIRAYEKYRQNP